MHQLVNKDIYSIKMHGTTVKIKGRLYYAALKSRQILKLENYVAVVYIDLRTSYKQRV